MTEEGNGQDATRGALEHLVRAADDALTDDMVARLAETAAGGMDLIDDVNRSGLKQALPAIAELVENGDLDRLVRLARVVGSAEDALTDDMIGRVAETAAGGMDLLDRVNRSGVEQALPAIAELVQNGDLDRVVRLARVVGSAEDALTDDMIGRMAETAAGGMELLDRVNRSGVARALPAVTQLVENGDLDRLVRFARVFGSAEDAVTDDMIGRLAGVAADGIELLDRLNRSGVVRFVAMLERMEASGGLERLEGQLERLADRLDEVEKLLGALDRADNETAAGPPAKGGLGGLLALIRPAENQDALRHLINMGKAHKER